MRRTTLPLAVVALVLASCGEDNDGSGSTGTSSALYEEGADGTQHALTVHMPTTEDGPWPIAVMVPPLGVSVTPDPSAVAGQGAVVFELEPWPNDMPGPGAETALAETTSQMEQVACAVRFARAEAERYGGDRSNLSLYGWSAGAMMAAVTALSDPGVAEGCVVRSGSAVPDNLVLFEGDWLLLAYTWWDDLLQEDPRVMDAVTPWSHLEAGTRMPVHLLDSDDLTLSRGAEGAEEWLALRDPTGGFFSDLEQVDAFEDGLVGETEAQRLLYERMQSLGYDVAFLDLPDSSHNFLSEAGVQVVIDAILQRT